MSADLVIVAAPDDPSWWSIWELVNRVTMIGGDDGPEEREVALGNGTYATSGLSFEMWRMPTETYSTLRAQLDATRAHVEVGQLSTLSAGLSGEYESYMPAAVVGVARTLRNHPLCTPAVIAAVMVAMNVPNRSIYGKPRFYYGERSRETAGAMRRLVPGHNHYMEPGSRGIARPRTVRRFLEQNLGARLATEVW